MLKQTNLNTSLSFNKCLDTHDQVQPLLLVFV